MKTIYIFIAIALGVAVFAGVYQMWCMDKPIVETVIVCAKCDEGIDVSHIKAHYLRVGIALQCQGCQVFEQNDAPFKVNTVKSFN